MTARRAFQLDFRPFPDERGPLRVADVPWESETFGFPFFQIEVDRVPHDRLASLLSAWLVTLPDDRPCFVQTSLPASQWDRAAALCGCGFYPIEMSYFMRLALREMPSPTANNGPPGQSSSSQSLSPAVQSVGRLRVAEAADLARLEELAGSAFSAVRLHVDPHLPRAACDRRMRQWVVNSFQSGEQILLYEHNQTGEVLGFVCCQPTSPNEVYFSLTAIDPAWQASGFVIPMFEAAFRHCAEQGYTTGTLRCSANNRGSFNLAVSLGFRPQETVMRYHWFRAARTAANPSPANVPAND